MAKTKRMIVTATAGVVGVLIAGGAAVAAANGASGSPTGVPAMAMRYNGQGGFSADGEQAGGQGQGGPGQGFGQGEAQLDGQGPGGGDFTQVTGDELTKVSAAVKKYDSGITIKAVMKDGDGNYDVRGTKDGKPIRLRISSDLATINEATGGQSGARGGPTPTGGGAGGASGGAGAGAGTPPDQSGGTDATTQIGTDSQSTGYTLST